MRIGLDYRLATCFPDSGIGRQNKALEAAFRARPENSVQLFGIAPEDHPIRRKVHCPRWGTPLNGFHRLPERFKFEALFLPKALQQAEIELYMCNVNMGLPIGRKPAGLRYVLQLHDLFQLTLTNSHASRLRKWVYGVTDRLSIAWSVKVADRIWTPSQFTADELVKHFPKACDKVRVLPNLVSEFTGEPADLGHLALPARYWLAVGTREPRKNMPWFIDAWQQARKLDPQVPELVLVGPAPHLPINQQHLYGVHFIEGVSDAELQGLYRHAERLWQPSYAEGFGLPVVEALGQGTPVAVASGSSLDEVTPPGSPRFSPTDTQALVDLMLSLATPPVEDREALKAWAKGYGLEAYRLRFNELFEELC
ncbi:MAG: glycosyltransferase family 1 protein [Pseudomonas sp.]|nr:glycosyltransferase family 1 protein [Pseudomonas sp.]